MTPAVMAHLQQVTWRGAEMCAATPANDAAPVDIALRLRRLWS
jgi:hypothetical protein